ncbi:MAG: diphosphate--fructose-6-phosphate 1-phosphotransferase, partial [Lachnospira sp.]|nr:diphosphate--fructose-6-phosphate 1-phosphotransferase [Lachnospira sp.]
MNRMEGNVIVGQSGGPTSVINASLAGVYKTAKDRGAKNVYGMMHGIKGLIDGQYVRLEDKIRSDLDIDLLKRTPSSFLGSCRFKLPEIRENEDLYKKIFKRLTDLDVKYFFYIGGNDSMDTIKKLSDYGIFINSDIRFIGVPKTIDNDLAVTDHTPGYGSAAKFIASTMKEIIRDGLVYDYPTISIVEIMGRNAGWLTAAAALAKGEDCEGVDLIYLPEKTFDIDHFMERIHDLTSQNRSLVI